MKKTGLQILYRVALSKDTNEKASQLPALCFCGAAQLLACAGVYSPIGRHKEAGYKGDFNDECDQGNITFGRCTFSGHGVRAGT